MIITIMIRNVVSLCCWIYSKRAFVMHSKRMFQSSTSYLTSHFPSYRQTSTLPDALEEDRFHNHIQRGISRAAVDGVWQSYHSSFVPHARPQDWRAVLYSFDEGRHDLEDGLKCCCATVVAIKKLRGNARKRLATTAHEPEASPQWSS